MGHPKSMANIEQLFTLFELPFLWVISSSIYLARKDCLPSFAHDEPSGWTQQLQYLQAEQPLSVDLSNCTLNSIEILSTTLKFSTRSQHIPSLTILKILILFCVIYQWANFNFMLLASWSLDHHCNVLEDYLYCLHFFVSNMLPSNPDSHSYLPPHLR